MKDVELVVEAVPERLDLSGTSSPGWTPICPPDTILATNTSSPVGDRDRRRDRRPAR